MENGAGGEHGKYGGKERCMQCLVGKPKEKRPLGQPMHRWEDYIKLNFKKQDRRAWTVVTWIRIGTSGRVL
jgi:hypothetical protein